MISEAGVLDQPLKEATIIVMGNAMRAHLNRVCVDRLASAHHARLVYVHARDQLKCSDAARASEIQRELDCLPDNDCNDTARRASLLPCLVGMPIMLKENIATELGLCNGAMGKLVALALHPHDEQVLRRSSASGEMVRNLCVCPGIVLIMIRRAVTF